MLIVLEKMIQNSQNIILILKSQQRFRSEKDNIFTEEINKIALSAKDDKRIQSIDSIEKRCIWNKQRASIKKEKN